MYTYNENKKNEKNRLWSNYIGRAACRCLFTSAIPRLLDMRSLTCSHIRASAGSTFLRRPGRRDSSTPTMSMPSFVRTLDQHRATTNRTPARKSFTQSDPRSSSGYRKTPRFPVDNELYEQTIYSEINRNGVITSNMINYGKYLIDTERHLSNSTDI